MSVRLPVTVAAKLPEVRRQRTEVRKTSKKFCRWFCGIEFAGLGHGNDIVKREEGGAVAVQVFEAVGIVESITRCQQDEFTHCPGNQVSADVAKPGTLVLDGEKDGNCITGPCSNLGCLECGHFLEFGIEG